MTRTTSARVAGFTLLFYIAVAFPAMLLLDRATSGEGIAAKLATVAQHVTDVRVAVVFVLLGSFAALVLAVTFYAITREVDPDLAMLALTCRVCEGVISGISIPETLGLLWLATTTGPDAPDSGAAHALGAYLLRGDMALTASFFAVGSALFCYLLLRGRIIPVPLAWLGVIASALLVVALPLQLAGWLRGQVTSSMYLPMLAFEVACGFWLLIKGASAPARRQSP